MKLADPVATRLPLLILLAAPSAAEYPADILPSRSPTVTVKRTVSLNLCPPWPRTDESDSQLVASQELRPVAKVPVADHDPTPEPCNVTLKDPVPAVFAFLDTLNSGLSTDSPAVKLPARTPTVAPTILLPRVPALSRQLNEVSDNHVEPSQEEWPIRVHAV